MMMKKIINISVYVVVLLLCGCDFLNRSPYDSVDTSQGFQTMEDAEAAVNAAYQPLQWAKLYNMRIWTLDIIAGNSEVAQTIAVPPSAQPIWISAVFISILNAAYGSPAKMQSKTSAYILTI